MKKNNYDCTGTLSDEQFLILVYWAEELSKEQIGNKFGFHEDWADTRLCAIYKLLDVHTRHGAVDEAWLKGIFTLENRNAIRLYLPTKANMQNGQLPFHADVKQRYENAGKQLEQLHKEVDALEADLRSFFAGNGKWLNRFHALNNSITQVQKIKSINAQEKKRREDIIFRIWDIIRENLPKHSELVYGGKARIDKIGSLTKLFTDGAFFLKAHNTDASLSSTKMREMESALETGLTSYKQICAELQYLKDQLALQITLYNQVVN